MKKILLPLLCLLPLAAQTNAETKTYQLCTDESEILNPDNQFILVASKTFNVSKVSNVFAATNSTSGSGVSIISNATGVPQEITVDAEDKGLGIFSIVDNGTSKVLFEHSQNVYWGLPTKNGIVTSGSLSESDSQYQLTVTVDESDYTVKIASGSRYLQFNSGTYFRGYTSNPSYCMPLFYKEVSKVLDPSYSGFNEKYDMLKGETLAFPKILPTELSYTFTSSDTSVVEVDADSKTFKAVGYGTATISFTTEAVADKFNAGEGSFTISVNKIKPVLKFRDQIVYGKLGVGVVWEPVQVLLPEDADLRGRITYSSSDPSIVSINEETGQSLPAVKDEENGDITDEGDVHAKGEVVITATMEETDIYASATASYTIIIMDPSEVIDGAFADAAVFDFTTEDPYGMTSTNNSSTYETVVHEIKIPGNQNVTITFPSPTDEDPADNSYRSWKSGDTYQLRMNKGARFVVSVAEGYKISKIGLTGTVANGTTYTPEGETTSDSDLSEEGWDKLKSTWITKDDEKVHEVRFDFPSSATGNVRLDKIYVLYESENSSYESADLSFENVVYSIYMNEPDKINGVQNPHNLDVTYRIPALDPTEAEKADPDYEEKYTIKELEDGSLEVFVTEPGYYTLEAVSNMNETYRDGLAILRLNVFYHVPVYVNGQPKEYPIGVIDVSKEDVTITMDVPELMNLYYKVDTGSQQAPKAKPFRAEAAEDEDENLLEGFTKYEDGIEIPQGTQGDLHFYVANYGYSSPVRSVGISTPVGVEEIVAPAEGTVRYYDLNGRAVSGKLLPGVYVRKSGNITEKVFVK